MTAQTYKQIIKEDPKNLPEEVPVEIADFVFSMRKRPLQSEFIGKERQSVLLGTGLKQMSRDKENHMEKEFEN